MGKMTAAGKELDPSPGASPRSEDTAALVHDLVGQGMTMAQTHVSLVFLDRDTAWKVKKPVDFGFLDYSTLEKRRLACEAEVGLNRRLSPEIYLGVAPITLDGNGRHILAGSGKAVEWAVRMVRLPEPDRGDRRLEAGTLTSAHLKTLADRLARFHAGAGFDPSKSEYGSLAAVARNVEENFNPCRDSLPAIIGPVRASALEAGFEDFLGSRAPLFAERLRSGRVRDGHGDLRLSQIYFHGEGRSSILDCIEFNERFRYGDVASDVAFLSMDLACRGRVDLAENFLAAYARSSGDYDLYALVDFYESYRACVRGKIAIMMARVPGAAPPDRDASEEEARRHFLFALSVLRKPLKKLPVIVFGGGIATGKSTLAENLGERLATPVLSSDWTRKGMAGLDPSERREEGLWQGLYREEFTDRVYAEMSRLAAVVLASGRPVILEASFRTRAYRDAIRSVARMAGQPFHFLECRAPDELVRTRLKGRARGPSVSDGREVIFEDFISAWEPAEELSAGECSLVDTSAPPEATLEEVMGLLAQHGLISGAEG